MFFTDRIYIFSAFGDYIFEFNMNSRNHKKVPNSVYPSIFHSKLSQVLLILCFISDCVHGWEGSHKCATSTQFQLVSWGPRSGIIINYPSSHPSTHQFVQPSIRPLFCPPTLPSVHPSVHPPFRSSTHQPTCKTLKLKLKAFKAKN